VGGGSGDIHINILHPFGMVGADTSSDPFDNHWFERPGSKQMDAVIIISDNLVPWGNHG